MARIFNLESMESLRGGPRTPTVAWRLYVCAFSREKVCSFHWILRASMTPRRVRTTTLKGQVLHMWEVQWQGKKEFSEELGRGGEDTWSNRRLEEEGAHGGCNRLKEYPGKDGTWASKNEWNWCRDRKRMLRACSDVPGWGGAGAELISWDPSSSGDC